MKVAKIEPTTGYIQRNRPDSIAPAALMLRVPTARRIGKFPLGQVDFSLPTNRSAFNLADK
jgi:hypothetical protein